MKNFFPLLDLTDCFLLEVLEDKLSVAPEVADTNVVVANVVLSVLARSEIVLCVVIIPSESSMLGGRHRQTCSPNLLRGHPMLTLVDGVPMSKTLVFSCFRKKQTDRLQVDPGD